MKKVLLSFAGSLLSFFSLAQDCGDDLFFSEYIEGSSYNKALELYNASSQEKELNDYEIQVFANGSISASFSFSPSGTIAPVSTYLIVHKSAEANLLALADTGFSGNSVVNFNGNDALILIKKSTGDTLDAIGTIGENLVWTVGTGTTSDFTLKRKEEIFSGNKNWNQRDQEWDIFSKDDFSSAGLHSVACVLTPISYFSGTELLVYPNPSFGETIRFSKSIRYLLYDLSGKLVLAGEGDHLSSEFGKGSYLLKTEEGIVRLIHFF